MLRKAVQFIAVATLLYFGGANRANATTVLDENFDFNAGPVLAPRWGCDPPVPVGTWLLGDRRADFQSTAPDEVHVSGGVARLYCLSNSATGGYLAFFRNIPSPLSEWVLTTRVKVNLVFGDRPVPSCLINSGLNPGEPCELFPNDDPIGALGFQTSSNQQLILRDGDSAAFPIQTGYTITSNVWHTVELISTSTGSELRAWPDGGARPAVPQATGISLGPIRRVQFNGPNFRNFDYSVDFVRVETLECFCSSGSVNAGLRPIVDTLFINGSTGGAMRTVEVDPGNPIILSMNQPPAQGSGRFVIHANYGRPSSSNVVTLPFGVGTMCNPLLASQGASPAAVWNSLGRGSLVGTTKYFDGQPMPDPDPASAILLFLPFGDPIHLSSGTEVTFQGVVVDPGSASSRRASATNAVTLKIR